jgi:hypothetical protein
MRVLFVMILMTEINILLYQFDKFPGSMAGYKDLYISLGNVFMQAPDMEGKDDLRKVWIEEGRSKEGRKEEEGDEEKVAIEHRLRTVLGSKADRLW